MPSKKNKSGGRKAGRKGPADIDKRDPQDKPDSTPSDETMASDEQQASSTPDKAIPTTPTRYQPFICFLHNLLLTIDALSDLHDDPTLLTLKILADTTSQVLSELLLEDGQTDWLAHDFQRTQTLIRFTNLHARLKQVDIEPSQSRQLVHELLTWFKQIGDGGALTGNWDPEPQVQKLDEIEDKIHAAIEAVIDKG